MTHPTESIKAINITDELKTSYLDYAMSVIMGRALPDARDGFKPVHRRVLYTMHIDGDTPDKPFVKSAEIVGKVMGLFHPHGDLSIYDTLVRMAQDWSLRYPLVQGQGNFGGRGDESPAAMRYTEARMSKMALEFIHDIDKETVDFIPNYSNKTVEPTVLPVRIPNLLINGSAGIAVGMATNIPPHNLSEVISGCIAYVDNPEITIDELMQHIPAPDFPTGGIILGRSGIREAYHTGKGKLTLRSVYSINEESRVKRINITEIPYQTSYNRIIERITELQKSGEVQGITEVLNLSKNNINIELRIHKDYDPNVIMNQLFAKTPLQASISFNMVALNNGKPHTFNLKDFIKVFIDFRREVITRRCVYELNKNRNRTHILEALSVALANIDEIIQLIRGSRQRKDAHEALMARGWKYDILKTMLAALDQDPAIARPELLDPKYGINADGLYYLTDDQARAILDMPLARLTGLEQDTITAEYQDLIRDIVRLIEILSNPEKLTEVLRAELEEVRQKHQTKANDRDARISQISDEPLSASDEDFINREDVVITLSKDSYIKRQALNEFRSQRRGGRGKQATQMKDEDIIDKMSIGATTDSLLALTNYGRAFKTKVHRLPAGSRNSRGRHISNYFELQDGELVTNLIVLTPEMEAISDKNQKYLMIVTEGGKIKRTKLSSFAKIRSKGIRAINLATETIPAGTVISGEGEEAIIAEQETTVYTDKVCMATVVAEEDNVYLFSRRGQCQAFSISTVKAQGRATAGVIGMKLADHEDKVVAVLVANSKTPKEEQLPIITITEKGMGKATKMELFPIRAGRNGKGIKAHKFNEKTGSYLVCALEASLEDQLVLITDGGKLVRINVDSIRQSGRASVGVRLINLTDGELLVSADRIINGKELEQEDLLAQQAMLEAEQLQSAETTDQLQGDQLQADQPQADQQKVDQLEPADVEAGQT